MQDQRAEALQGWLNALPSWQDGQLAALPGDASFRRYFRYQHEMSGKAIVMDAPPPQEDVRPFLHVRDAMASLGVCVPACYARDELQGFLLLEDFGDTTLSQAIARSDEVAVDHFYQQALLALANWQTHGRVEQAAHALPNYDAALLVKEMQLLPEWLLAVHVQQPMSAFEQSDWQNWIRLLSGSALAQPQTFVHRDYHSRNLMVTDDARLGVIDFQDAVRGALTYDAVSLLRDAYVVHEPKQVNEWLRYYFLLLVKAGKLAQGDWADFVLAFDRMGVQRHLKVLGIFARLYHRDGKDRYLADLPTVFAYVLQVAAKDNALSGLASWLEKRLSASLMG